MNRSPAIRDEVLMQLVAAFPAQVPVERLHKTARRSGFDYAELELRKEAHFLAGLEPPLVEVHHDAATNQEKFSATSAGVTHFENQ